MNETIKTIIERRSVKNYETKQVPQEKLDLILKAGTYAASGRGLQPSVILVIQDEDIIKELSKINAEIFERQGDPFYGAPTILMVLTEKDRSTGIEDASLVLGNMMLAAHSLGLGTCWIHRARQELNYKYVQEMLERNGIDHTKYIGVGHLSLGYPKGEIKPAAPRKEDYIRYIK